MAASNSNLKSMLVPFGLVAFLAGGAVILHALDEKRLEKDIAVIPQGNVSPWIYGPPQADYTLTLYSDLECPYCKAFQPIAKRWVDNTDGVNLRWHHLPLEGHGSVAMQEALLAECSGRVNGNDAFWTTIDAVFALMRSDGLDWVPAWSEGTVRECMARPETLATLQGQIESAHQAGITATPTSLLTDNRTGKTVKLEGVSGPEVLDSAVDWLARE